MARKKRLPMTDLPIDPDRNRTGKPWVRHKISERTGEIVTARIPRFVTRSQPKGFVEEGSEEDVRWHQRLEDENVLAPMPPPPKPETTPQLKPAPVRRGRC